MKIQFCCAGKPLQYVAISRHHELLYNMGIQALHCGKPSQAFDCLIMAVQVYQVNPRLWLRLAECCIMHHKEVGDRKKVNSVSWENELKEKKCRKIRKMTKRKSKILFEISNCLTIVVQAHLLEKHLSWCLQVCSVYFVQLVCVCVCVCVCVFDIYGYGSRRDVYDAM